MKILVMRKRIFLSAAAICALWLTVSFVLRYSSWEYSAFFALMGTALAAVLFIAAHKKHSSAKVIAEAAVIRIQPAVICAQSDYEIEKWKRLREDSVVYVSCFGILIGTKIIMYNQGGIRLRHIEIGSDYISFDYEIPADRYGMKKEKQSIRLLYTNPGEEELAVIVEKFRKETGIVPVFIPNKINGGQQNAIIL